MSPSPHQPSVTSPPGGPRRQGSMTSPPVPSPHQPQTVAVVTRRQVAASVTSPIPRQEAEHVTTTIAQPPLAVTPTLTAPQPPIQGGVVPVPQPRPLQTPGRTIPRPIPQTPLPRTTVTPHARQSPFDALGGFAADAATLAANGADRDIQATGDANSESTPDPLTQCVLSQYNHH